MADAVTAMGAIKDLWQSERGLLAVVLVLACTALCALGSLTNEQWLDYTRWLFISYAAAKTITGTAAIVSGQNRQTTSVTTVATSGVTAATAATTVVDCGGAAAGADHCPGCAGKMEPGASSK